MIVKSASNSDFNRGCHTTRDRRANGIVNCFIAIVGSYQIVLQQLPFRVKKNDNIDVIWIGPISIWIYIYCHHTAMISIVKHS
ncbi:Uncharacterized protein DBV15_09221 [Temnothorax longispinosus]|uniref:Uncharacterized protein n=1 Tax=Temnothorax longispinosus TaxID=300112 RepID=A0A4S2L563_9HYME|nr:Uncharacterized protein DBV15_09221 [Temnothorax longispinosus]